MKYTLFGFSQKKLIEFELSLNDAAFLRWFIDFKDARKNGKPVMVSQIIEERLFYWVNYTSVREEYPILKISSNDSIYRRFKELAKKGILDHRTVKAGGTFSYYALGDKYYELISEDDNEKEDISKDEKLCIESFDKNICKLKTTDKSEFLKICKNNNIDFILRLIELCGKKGKTFKYFVKSLNEKLEKGVNSKELLEKAIEEFKKEKIKESEGFDINKKVEEELFALRKNGEKISTEDGEELKDVKEQLKTSLTDIEFNTWIAPATIIKNDLKVIVCAPNEFSKGIVEKKYELNIIRALQDLSIKYDFIRYDVAE